MRARFMIDPMRRLFVKLMQIAFIAVLGTMCLATVATSKTIHPPCEVSVQEVTATAPTKI